MPPTIACPGCHSPKIRKKGLKKNKSGNLQKYQCRQCARFFTLKKSPHAYPMWSVLKALSLYSQGYSLSQVSQVLAKIQKKPVPPSTVSAWLKKYDALLTYRKLRKEALHLYKPKDVLFTRPLQHRQVYHFKYHKAKLRLLPRLNPLIPGRVFTQLTNYLQKIPTPAFPHHIFGGLRGEEKRSSQLRFKTLEFLRRETTNQANRLAELALQSVTSNYQRHYALQEFMLLNDTSTVAVEIPVYLTKHDVGYFLERNFRLPLEGQATPITGHIDILQVRNNLLHVLDYKPEAAKVNPVPQLTLYALALASRLQIPVRQLKVAWFDDKDYFEFFPLHAVYGRRGGGAEKLQWRRGDSNGIQGVSVTKKNNDDYLNK